MPVCIAGMHRSGTSMVTKYLHDAGLYLGDPDRLMPAASQNPEGFWEHLDIVDLNEEILNRLGGGWDCPPPEPNDWTAPPLAALVPRAMAILEPLSDRDPWGWKDPRTSLTLPFWRALLPDLRTVIVVRHPLEVALSLRQRNGFSFALGLTLWQLTNLRLLENTTPDTRVVTHFDAWFGDLEPEIRRLADFARLDVAEPTFGQFRDGATPSLRHHRLTTHDLLDADVSPHLRELYDHLCDEAGWRDTDGTRVVPGSRTMSAGVNSAPTDHAPTSLEIGVGHTDRSRLELGSLQRELASFRESLTNREERVAELEAALTLHEETAVIRDATIADLVKTIGEREVADAAAVADRDRWRRRAKSSDQALTVAREPNADLTEHIEQLSTCLRTGIEREEHLRTLLTSAHEQLAHRDAEMLGTLGATLADHAPGAPSAIYYRQLVEKTAALVSSALPPSVPALVISGGDEAMRTLDGRPTWHFPEPATDKGLDGEGAAAIARLETLRQRGAGFLVVPASGRAWLARYPDLVHHLRRYAIVASDETVAHIYGLSNPVATSP